MPPYQLTKPESEDEDEDEDEEDYKSMIRKIDKVRAGRATNLETVIRAFDKYWFRVLGGIHRWTIRQAGAHCRREKMRRFRRIMASGTAWKN